MRLLNIDTFKLEDFIDDDDVPPYAILSHTWGPDEVTLQDVFALDNAQEQLYSTDRFASGSAQTLDELHLFQTNTYSKQGWQKIENFCKTLKKFKTLGNGPNRYAWIDTCCIDKTSSAELSEAINSMFRWYRDAAVCFVALEDVEIASTKLGIDARVGPDFEQARWFSRGWTLQELLAPEDLIFFDKNWDLIGEKLELAQRISDASSIDIDVIITASWESCCIAQRMSWASRRRTTRRKDMTYCLLGLFDVNMPLLYGEGDRAFIRLQEAILQSSNDGSIFAWDASMIDPSIRAIGMLAPHPSYFRDCGAIEAILEDQQKRDIKLKKDVIEATLGSLTIKRDTSKESPLQVRREVSLDCRFSYDFHSEIVIGLGILNEAGSEERFTRARGPIRDLGRMYNLSSVKCSFLKTSLYKQPATKRIRRCLLDFRDRDFTFTAKPELLHGQWVNGELFEGQWAQGDWTEFLTFLLPSVGSKARADPLLIAVAGDFSHRCCGQPEENAQTASFRACLVIKIEPLALRGSSSVHVLPKQQEDNSTFVTREVIQKVTRDAHLNTLPRQVNLSDGCRLKTRTHKKVKDDAFQSLEIRMVISEKKKT